MKPDLGAFPFRDRRYHFSGVGGSGMTPLAILAVSLGAEVTGSDRNLDRGLPLPSFSALRDGGVRLVPQDGSAVTPDLTAFVYSTAVETANPDFRRATELGVERIRRGSFLAGIAGARRAIAIAGTSGKSTVTAMTAHVLLEAGFDPTFLGGGAAVRLKGAVPPGSLRLGESDWFVVETDESDGSVAEFAPAIAVLTNLSRDHKEIDETARAFEALLENTRERAVIHSGDPILERVRCPDRLPRIYAAIEGVPTWAPADLVARSVRLSPDSVRFKVDRVEVSVPFPGAMTVENALLAIAAAVAAGVPLERAAAAMASFGGVRRRLEPIGAVDGIDVFDDFGHNPVKIRAALEALRPKGSLWVYYQPHGYAPTRFFKDELIETLRVVMRPQDHLLLAPIYDAGGTTDRSICSEEIVEALRKVHVDATLAATRAGAALEIAKRARAGDRAVVMGARDDTLPAFAREILAALEEHAGSRGEARAETPATRPAR
ncbi:MAG: UDP-N-acetylmuramate--alanine ligase [Candidatus Eisenbacteria bacterium]|uniref:UDP-N-acetylmuramate--alanine ligase n=1 Tax=Eiseniibacteriota bacterium TaxID=2212470 RepID=A0A538TN35_UNCEI|nr:MAG: UDP-N-acetylmuramate--alanine ligase [Candidatus Eisenbacteria bacterium]